jgi:hypothetical protein
MPTQRRPPARRTLPEPQGTPPATDRPPANGAPPTSGTRPAKGAPPASSTPPTKGAPSVNGTPPAEGARPGHSRPNANGRTPGNGRPSGYGGSSGNGAPPETGTPTAERAPSQPDTPGAQPWQVPPCPCHSPATGRPLPDLTALHLAAVPDSSPPYDDQLRTGPSPWPGEYSPLSVAPYAEMSPHAGGPPHAGTPPHAKETPGGTAPLGQGGKQGVNQQPRDDRQPRGSAEKAQRGYGERSPGRHGEPAPGGSAAGPAKRRPGNGGGAEPDEWPSQFAQVLAETLAGSRPASQIVPWTTERARAHIRRLGPLLAVEQRPRVQRVITSRPAEDVVEVAAIIGFGPRTRALAARLELARPRAAVPGRPAREARWLCTAVESA